METSIVCGTLFFQNILWPRCMICHFFFLLEPNTQVYTCFACHLLFSILIILTKCRQSQLVLRDLSCHFRSQRLASWWPCESYWFRIACLMREVLPIPGRHDRQGQARSKRRVEESGAEASDLVANTHL